MTSIVWFRQDLRTADNPALSEAARLGEVVPVYILDEAAPPMGGASLWWLHHSLAALEKDLGRLVLLRGEPGALLADLVKQAKAKAIFWNRCYEPHAITRDKQIKSALSADGIDVASFNASLLHEPWEVKNGSGAPFKVFTPFWKAARALPVEAPLPGPKLKLSDTAIKGEDRLGNWQLLPTRPNWAAGWDDIWTPGEKGAAERLKVFLKHGLKGYGDKRNRPDLPNVSRLSPHLHFGEISPRQIWHTVQDGIEKGTLPQGDADKFLSEVGWREFSYQLLFNSPDLPEKSWRPAFDAFQWRTSAADLKAWQKGQTGYPLVDAGMRELWATGWMHNRVRMVVASFLIKHLRIDWREGAAWFWDTLVDADLANNSASWQWVAGSGADAAPYFRIFNPTEQGRKFDPDGVYIRRWVPEIAQLPDAHIHAPFEAPVEMLKAAGVRLGDTYPKPIVDHKEARKAALEAYEPVKAEGNERRAD